MFYRSSWGHSAPPHIPNEPKIVSIVCAGLCRKHFRLCRSGIFYIRHFTSPPTCSKPIVNSFNRLCAMFVLVCAVKIHICAIKVLTILPFYFAHMTSLSPPPSTSKFHKNSLNHLCYVYPVQIIDCSRQTCEDSPGVGNTRIKWMIITRLPQSLITTHSFE